MACVQHMGLWSRYKEVPAQGGRGSFRCIIEGATEVAWTKVGGEINSQTTMIRGAELYFTNPAVEDRGVYVCGKQFIF